MARSRARSAVKAQTLSTRSDILSWLLISCTFLMLASLIPMWSHWLEISATLGFVPAACALTAVTGAGFIVSWWLNSGNE